MTGHDHGASEAAVRDLYRRRDLAGKRTLYAAARGETVAWGRTRARAARAALDAAGLLDDLARVRVLDVGCGTGGWLAELAGWGASPSRLVGVELLGDRLREGKGAHPELALLAASGWRLPLADASVDLATLFTVLSSLPEPGARRALGDEIRRVVRPGGWALVYDFRVRRPGSRDLVGIGPGDAEAALGAPAVWRRSLTLAPPLARILGRMGAGGVVVAERLLPIFRTHRMYLFRLS